MNFKRLASLVFVITICAAIIGYVATKQKQNHHFKAIIFDMDGTIIDTDRLWKQASFSILDSHAPHMSQDEKTDFITSCKHLTIHEVWSSILKQCSVPLSINELIEQNIQHLHIIYTTQGIEFIAHFPEFHEKVVNKGLKTAVATSSELRTVNVILDSIPLNNYFDEHIYHADHVNKAYKPQPDVFLYAAKMIGVDPKDCIVIEDSPSGIKAAKAAGMYCVGINTSKNRGLLQQADEIIDCYRDIDLDKLLSKQK